MWGVDTWRDGCRDVARRAASVYLLSVLNRFILSIEDRVLLIRAHGVWSQEVQDEFLAALERTIEKLPEGRPWATLVDFTQYEDTSENAMILAHQAVEIVEKAGRSHGAFLIGALEFGRRMIESEVISPERQHVKYFQTERRAREWLAELGYLDAE